MNLLVAQRHGHALQRNLFQIGIQADRHGRARAEARQQQVVRRGPAIETSRRGWLIGDQPMRPDRDRLLELAGTGLLHDDGVARTVEMMCFGGRRG